MALAKHSLVDRIRPIIAPLERSDRAELMDEPGLDPVELAGNLRDIRRVNKLLGGTSIILRHLPSLLASAPPSQPLTLLDLATGSADIPIAIANWAVRRGLQIEIVASDYSEEMLANARRELVGRRGIELARHDARAVGFPDDAFDVVVCSLSLHHFSPDDAVQVLREMKRLARRGFILNDLRRSRPGYAAARLAAMTTTRNRLTRHDAPLSVQRAYTPDELRDLLHRASVDDATITTHPWFRMAAVWREKSHD